MAIKWNKLSINVKYTKESDLKYLVDYLLCIKAKETDGRRRRRDEKLQTALVERRIIKMTIFYVIRDTTVMAQVLFPAPKETRRLIQVLRFSRDDFWNDEERERITASHFQNPSHCEFFLQKKSTPC